MSNSSLPPLGPRGDADKAGEVLEVAGQGQLPGFIPRTATRALMTRLTPCQQSAAVLESGEDDAPESPYDTL